MPFSENVFSMMTEPEKMLMNQPMIEVMIGSSAFCAAPGMFPAPNVSSTTPRSFSVISDAKCANWMPGKTLTTPIGSSLSGWKRNSPSGTGRSALRLY